VAPLFFEILYEYIRITRKEVSGPKAYAKFVQPKRSTSSPLFHTPMSSSRKGIRQGRDRNAYAACKSYVIIQE
jgi:hypothetical protein